LLWERVYQTGSSILQTKAGMPQSMNNLKKMRYFIKIWLLVLSNVDAERDADVLEKIGK
jgi:hypothetical protein